MLHLSVFFPPVSLAAFTHTGSLSQHGGGKKREDSCSECFTSLVVPRQCKVVLMHSVESTIWKPCSLPLPTHKCCVEKAEPILLKSGTFPPFQHGLRKVCFALICPICWTYCWRKSCSGLSSLFCTHAVKHKKSSVWVSSTWLGELTEVVTLYLPVREAWEEFACLVKPTHTLLLGFMNSIIFALMYKPCRYL